MWNGAQAALTTNCRAVLQHAQSRKAYRGAILMNLRQEPQQSGQSADTPSQTGLGGLGGQLRGVVSAGRGNQTAKANTSGKAAMPTTNKQRKRKSR